MISAADTTCPIALPLPTKCTTSHFWDGCHGPLGFSFSSSSAPSTLTSSSGTALGPRSSIHARSICCLMCPLLPLNSTWFSTGSSLLGTLFCRLYLDWVVTFTTLGALFSRLGLSFLSFFSLCGLSCRRLRALLLWTGRT